MRACLALCVIAALVGAARAKCSACIDGRCYNKHFLSDAGFSNGALHRQTNTLYYTSANAKRNKHFIATCNLDTATCTDTTTSGSFKSYAVDQTTGDLFAIDSDDDYRLYKYDLVNKTKVLWAPSTGVGHVTFKDKLYYSLMQKGGIYAVENGVPRFLDGTSWYDFIEYFIVNKNDDIYFRHFSNFQFYIKKWSKGVVYYTGLWNGYKFDKATVDKDDNAIFIGTNSHAVYRVTNNELVEIGAVEHGLEKYIIFDRDNNFVHLKYDDDNKKFSVSHYKQERNVRCTGLYTEWSLDPIPS